MTSVAGRLPGARHSQHLLRLRKFYSYPQVEQGGKYVLGSRGFCARSTSAQSVHGRLSSISEAATGRDSAEAAPLVKANFPLNMPSLELYQDDVLLKPTAVHMTRLSSLRVRKGPRIVPTMGNACCDTEGLDEALEPSEKRQEISAGPKRSHVTDSP